jgi:hypothetical protein
MKPFLISALIVLLIRPAVKAPGLGNAARKDNDRNVPGMIVDFSDGLDRGIDTPRTIA